MSEDPEVERIMKRMLRDMVVRQASGTQDAKQSAKPGVANLNGGTFTAAISGPNATLVDFWAEWCGPCKSMHPVFEAVSREYPHVRFARVNVDQCPDIAAAFGVVSIPTFIMFKSGTVVDRLTGAAGPGGIRGLCNKHG